MRIAFALLGVGFVTIIVVGYFMTLEVEAPTANTAPDTVMTLTLTSPAFTAGGKIPSLYTCDGENINPPLHISGVPSGTQSFVLTVEDPDIPQAVKDKMGINVLDHWVVFNIPSTTTDIPENTAGIGASGMGARGDTYLGPCPPREYEPREHRYIFTLYALSSPPTLAFIKAPTKDDVVRAVESQVIEKSILIGRYERVALPE